MRRSAAPSQVLGNVAKKPRFIPPGKSNAVCPKVENEETDQDVKSKEVKMKNVLKITFVSAVLLIKGCIWAYSIQSQLRSSVLLGFDNFALTKFDLASWVGFFFHSVKCTQENIFEMNNGNQY